MEGGRHDGDEIAPLHARLERLTLDVSWDACYMSANSIYSATHRAGRIIDGQISCTDEEIGQEPT